MGFLQQLPSFFKYPNLNLNLLDYQPLLLTLLYFTLLYSHIDSTTTTTTTITTSAIMSLLQPQMSFAQTYILASKVRSKLTREAQSPKSSLRNLVVQANMLDNIMDYISDETKRRTSEKLTSKTNTQKSSSGYLSPESSVVQFAPTQLDKLIKLQLLNMKLIVIHPMMMKKKKMMMKMIMKAITFMKMVKMITMILMIMKILLLWNKMN